MPKVYTNVNMRMKFDAASHVFKRNYPNVHISSQINWGWVFFKNIVFEYFGLRKKTNIHILIYLNYVLRETFF